MFARDFLSVAQPFEAVAPRLVRDAAWMDPIAYDAVVGAVRTLGALHPGEPLTLDLPPIAVHCTRGLVRIRDDALVMPLRWNTNLPLDVLPRVTSDLEVAPLGRDCSHVVMSATYDRVAMPDHSMRRAIETALRVFLQGLAARLHHRS